jgi:hypothetical protein
MQAARPRAPRRGGCVIALPILLSVLIVASSLIVQSCGSISTTTRTPTPTSATKGCNQAEARLWTRGDIAVGLAFAQPISPTSPGDQDIISAVVSQLDSFLKSETGAPETVVASTNPALPQVIRQRNSATVFLNLQSSGSSTIQICDSSLIAAIDATNQMLNQRASSLTIDGDTAALTGASPNWLGSSTPGTGGDSVEGSPSNIASPAAIGTTINPIAATPKGAHVIVLDTGYALSAGHSPLATCSSGLRCLPAAKPVTSATLATDLGGTLPGGISTQILNSLLPDLSESDLAVDAQGYENFGSNTPVSEQDHGLFISEMIHHLAPGATITIVRMLNDYGIGDLQTLLTALQTIAFDPEQLGLTLDPNVPIVINLSLEFGPSVDCLLSTWHTWTKIAAGSHTSITCPGSAAGTAFTLSPTDARLLAPIGQALADISGSPLPNGPTVQIVAASGNDSTASNRLNAAMPAAFCSVTAVAATDPSLSATASVGSLAAFSNLPFVGTVQQPQCLDMVPVASPLVVPQLASLSGTPVEMPGVNICSVHLEPIGGTPPPGGAAVWSGTSFATALVSGNLAEGLSTTSLSSFDTSEPCKAP